MSRFTSTSPASSVSVFAASPAAVHRLGLRRLSAYVVAGLMASASVGAMAQPAAAASAPMGAAPSAMMGKHGGAHSPEKMAKRMQKMQAHQAKRQAELKGKLALSPAQEGAWTAYTTSQQWPMRQTADRPTAEQRAAWAALPTPERIDQTRALRQTRMAAMSAAMDQRDQGTKTFYAALTPAQKTTFDAARQQRKDRGHGHGHGKKASQLSGER